MDWLAAARRWRPVIAALQAGEVGHLVVADQAEDIALQHGEAAGEAFMGIAYGTRTPMLHHLESWLTEGGAHGPLSDHTIRQYRADVTRFAAWCGTQGVATLEGVSRIAAAEDQDMHDLIVVATLTGARLSEITGLRVRDCTDGWLTIRQGKTAAAARRIPLHPMLTPIVARRSEQKRAGDHLFNGRAQPASKRFSRLRQAAGVHELAPDRRQSEVTFHSIRHWTTTTLRNAGADRLIVDILTGHKPQGETDGRYFGKADDALLIKAIGSLRLPTHGADEPAQTEILADAETGAGDAD